jgi:hypothetical protein
MSTTLHLNKVKLSTHFDTLDKLFQKFAFQLKKHTLFYENVGIQILLWLCVNKDNSSNKSY